MKKKDLEIIVKEQRDFIIELKNELCKVREDLTKAKEDSEMYRRLYASNLHDDTLLQKFVDMMKAEITLLEGGSENLPTGAAHA